MSAFNRAVEDTFITITFAEYGIAAPVFGYESHQALQSRSEVFTG